MSELVIKLTSSLAAEMRNTKDRSSTGIGRILAAHGLRLGDATGSVGETAQYFSLGEVASENIDKLIENLQRQPGVEAAYVKPSDALP